MAYLYIHRTLDTDSVFYVGISNHDNNKYKRAYSKHGRSKFWKNIVEKHGYKVHILFKDRSWKDICVLEQECIKYHGRRDIQSGASLLCNLTDGGEGSEGIRYTEEQLNNRRGSKNHKYGKRYTEEELKILSKKLLDRNYKHSDKIKQKLSEVKSTIILNTETGIFYYGCKEASKSIGVKESTLKAWLNGQNSNKSNLVRT